MYAIRSYYENDGLKFQQVSYLSEFCGTAKKVFSPTRCKILQNSPTQTLKKGPTEKLKPLSSVVGARGLEPPTRITSYNVCYTKLLREVVVVRLTLIGRRDRGDLPV